MKAFKNQIDVNFYGYVYVAKAFLPIVKEYVLQPGARRGRFAFVSSGPVPGPGVPFITSYMAAKWAGDALCQGLRMEMRLRQLPIDCVMVSPGVVKPTRLAEEGEKLLERTFADMPPEATTEYKEMVNAFRKFQVEAPGTHVSVVGEQMEKIMRHGKPWMRYFVGEDAVASIVVGLLPTGLREHLLRNTLMMHYEKIPRFFFK
jgi:NAD(P)-dependent dehydrogenase (short-subunit alcohol dehydrogenase family)